MSKLNHFEFKQVEWKAAAGDIIETRKKVFVIEQRFDKEVLCDQYDHECFHLLIKNNMKKLVGCGRLTHNGRIGKIAVLIGYRGLGLGTQLLSQLINIAQMEKISTLTLNAEAELVSFYDQQKFNIDGPVYMKQGIPYHRMCKKLA